MNFRFIMILFVFILNMSGCSSNPPNIQQYQEGIYMSIAGSIVSYQKAMSKAFGDAHAFCEQKSLKMQLIKEEKIYQNLKESIVYFKCIEP